MVDGDAALGSFGEESGWASVADRLLLCLSGDANFRAVMGLCARFSSSVSSCEGAVQSLVRW